MIDASAGSMTNARQRLKETFVKFRRTPPTHQLERKPVRQLARQPARQLAHQPAGPAEHQPNNDKTCESTAALGKPSVSKDMSHAILMNSKFHAYQASSVPSMLHRPPPIDITPPINSQFFQNVSQDHVVFVVDVSSQMLQQVKLKKDPVLKRKISFIQEDIMLLISKMSR